MRVRVGSSLAAACSFAFSLLVACHVAEPVAAHKNPFLDQKFYVSAWNAEEFDASLAEATGKVQENLLKMQKVPSAYWVDKKSKIRGEGARTAEGILKDAASKSPPELVVFIWYDLPNRDCDAKASNGEICCTKNPDGTCDYSAVGDCAEGLAEYKTEYVDPFAELLGRYHDKLQIVVVVEPDSLPNLATNLEDQHCGNSATQTAYTEGLKYAVGRLVDAAPSVAIYLDAAHGGWLGWENNLEKFTKAVGDLQLPLDKLRGFATNVANYQALGVQCPWCPDQNFRNGYCLHGDNQGDPCCEDPCNLEGQWNFGNNELNYAAGLVAAARGLLAMDAHVIIDTGRNGVTNQRKKCSNWCNPRGAGAGIPATTETANTSMVDAYFWLKTPGESDGCSELLPNGEKCPRFDDQCASVDSIGTGPGEPRAVEAGNWFDFQVKQLAQNAVFSAPTVRSAGSCPANSGTNAPPPPLLVPAPAPAQSACKTAACKLLLNKTRPAPGSCGDAYQQCGGKDWTGALCCKVGCSCVKSSNGLYSSCVPHDPASQKCGARPTSSRLVSTTKAAKAGRAGGGMDLLAVSVESSLRVTSKTPTTTHKPTPSIDAFKMLGSPDRHGSSDKPEKAPVMLPVVDAPMPHLQPLVTLAPLLTLPPLPTLPPMMSVPTQTPEEAEALQVSTSSSNCARPYSQCGGSNWEGPTCCDGHMQCEVVNSKESKCLPKDDQPRLTPVSDSPGAAMAVILKDEVQRAIDTPMVLSKDTRQPLQIISSALPWATVPLCVLGAVGALALLARHMRWGRYMPLASARQPGLGHDVESL